MIDEQIESVMNGNLLNELEVKNLCEKVRGFSLGLRNTFKRIKCSARAMSRNHMWRCSWPIL